MLQLVSIYRINVYCPLEDVEPLIEVITKEFDISVGKYDGVFWRSLGKEQFTPTQSANATEGEIGKVSITESEKLEFSIPASQEILDSLLKKIDEIHSWEQPVVIVNQCQSLLKC